MYFMFRNLRRRFFRSTPIYTLYSARSAPQKSRRKLLLESLEHRITPTVGLGFAVGGDSHSAGIVQPYGDVTDSQGDTYVTGFFQGTVHFGSVTLAAQSTVGEALDGFVAKYSPTGGVDWAVDIGGADALVEGQAIAVNSAGDVYTTGYMAGTDVNFGPSVNTITGASNTGPIVITTASTAGLTTGMSVAVSGVGGNTDANGTWTVTVTSPTTFSLNGSTGNGAYTTGGTWQPVFSSSESGTVGSTYISELNSSGDMVYTAVVGNGGYSEGEGIAVDSSGDGYVTGKFSGTDVSFNPNATGNTLTSSSAGTAQNSYVLKLLPGGTFGYVAQLGSGGSSGGVGIAVDSSGNAYSIGTFSGTNVNFNPGGTLDFTSATSITYVSELNSTGGFVYASQIGTGGTTSGAAISVDGSGDAFITGRFSGTDVNFSPSGTAHTLSSSSSGSDNNIFVEELDPSGDYTFAIATGTGGSGLAAGIALDPTGDIYVDGQFTGTAVDFGTATYDSGTGPSAFVLKLSTTGTYLLSTQLGVGGSIVQADGLALDGFGNINVVGNFTGTSVNFDPSGTGSNNLTSSKDGSIFLVQLTQLALSPTTLSAGSQGSAYGPVTISVANGTGPYTFSVASGTLPAGLQLDPTTGVINGVPTAAAGTYDFTVVRHRHDRPIWVRAL